MEALHNVDIVHPINPVAKDALLQPQGNQIAL